MKNLFIFLALILINNYTFGQTKKETEDWISEKIVSYQVSNSVTKFYYSISYTDSTMIVKSKGVFYFDDGTSETRLKTAIIPIKNLQKPIIKEQENSVAITIKCKNSEENIINTDRVGDYNSSEFTFILNRSFITDGLKDRFNKAFESLIKFYGGTIVKEAY